MKGIFNDVITIFAVLIFMVGATTSVISLISEMSVVTYGLVKPSFEKLAVIDIAHNLKSCIYEKGMPREISQKILDDCREKSGASYAEVIDINSLSAADGKISSGSQAKGQPSHAIYINIQTPEKIRHARLSVYSSGLSWK